MSLLWRSAVGLLVVLAAGVVPLPVAARVTADGVIEGQVRNGTAGAVLPAGLPVVLHAVSQDDRVDRRQAVLDEQGRYRFDGLDSATGLKYLPVVEYGGALYFPRPIVLDGQTAVTDADITVYEPTPSDRWIGFERANLLIQSVDPERLGVMEMGAVANAGDRTYVGPDAPPDAPRSTLRFSVPRGAVDLTPQVGLPPNDIAPTPNGFSIASPIVPGRHQLAYSYGLPFTSPQLDVVKRLEYPTLNFALYVPNVGLQIDSPQLTPQGEADLGGQKFLLYGAQNLPAGTELRVRLGGLPTRERPISEQLSWPLLGLGCAALAAGIVMVHRRRLSAPLAAVATASSNGAVHDDREQLERLRLLMSIARLDERFERGELAEDDYRQERERGKRRLVALAASRDEAQRGED